MRTVEREVAELTTMLDNVREDVAALAPVVELATRLDVRMGNVETGIERTAKTIGAIRTALEDRDKQATDERKSVRIALIGLTGVILAALIAAVATIVVAGMA